MREGTVDLKTKSAFLIRSFEQNIFAIPEYKCNYWEKWQAENSNKAKSPRLSWAENRKKLNSNRNSTPYHCGRPQSQLP